MPAKKYTAKQLRTARAIVDQEEATRAERVRRLKMGAKATAKAIKEATRTHANSATQRIRKLALLIIIYVLIGLAVVFFVIGALNP